MGSSPFLYVSGSLFMDTSFFLFLSMGNALSPSPIMWDFTGRSIWIAVFSPFRLNVALPGSSPEAFPDDISSFFLKFIMERYPLKFTTV